MMKRRERKNNINKPQGTALQERNTSATNTQNNQIV